VIGPKIELTPFLTITILKFLLMGKANGSIILIKAVSQNPRRKKDERKV